MKQRIPFTDTFESVREHLHFILVEPQSPGNVGAVARAMKTCGFYKLILVNPCRLDTEEIKMMAHRSMDIIENALIVSDYREAFREFGLLIATTMRRRHFKFPFHTPEEISDKILPAAMEQPVGIVFGRERTGLTNEELLQCHLHSTITTASQNPALNLSQAVMIYAHTFFMHANQINTGYQYKLASQKELEKFYDHLKEAMEMVRFVPRDGLDSFITRFRRLLGRASTESRDIQLLHKLLQIFETRIRDLEKEAGGTEKREIY